MASGDDFVAFTGAGSSPKVETATNFTPATSARVQRNWEFLSVRSDLKADTDLQNVDADLTDEEKSTIRTRLGAIGAG